MTALTAKITDTFSSYAPFSWLIAGLAGALICSVIAFLSTKSLFWFAQAKWARMWSRPSDNVNPLDDSFVRRRILINDFVSPAHWIIESKNFDRCELIGPTLVLLNNVHLHSPQMFDCNFVACKDNYPAHNIVVLKDVNLINCRLYRLTFLVPETAVATFSAFRVPWLSREPSEFNQPTPWPKSLIPNHAGQIQESILLPIQKEGGKS